MISAKTYLRQHCVTLHNQALHDLGIGELQERPPTKAWRRCLSHNSTVTVLVGKTTGTLACVC